MKRTTISAHSSNYYPTRNSRIRVIVIHSGETGEGSTPAEGMGSWFANAAANASAHKGVDTDSACTYLPDSATAWAAPGVNADGLHLELAGRAGQTSGQWDDTDSRAILANAAIVAREWADKHDIPKRWLTDAQLRDGRSRGFATHAQVSRVFKRSSHWDPGPNFPAARFLSLVTGGATTAVDAPTYTREDVARLQRVLGLDDDGIWGGLTERQALALRRTLKPGLRAGVWDRVRYWRLRRSRPKRKQSSDSMRRSIQWALKVEADGDWGPATDAAWLAMRQQHKR